MQEGEQLVYISFCRERVSSYGTVEFIVGDRLRCGWGGMIGGIAYIAGFGLGGFEWVCRPGVGGRSEHQNSEDHGACE
ncbi:uncharacterized protein BP01DRAFT_360231 [Aspergillus saccharolyticus JOP 1030-1]|uniref:Uncharacterized protein n=1 Tax=Aspergillus saccharolyticus JOP 1030-1 TaxID=1450539 RepID=A0A319A271_9EURO|nr:hypothetical protein BP01DRAFT_360231 [Aspergillus saccharolyticus JOP 1030-1]PYH41582.1 hypothetical protein BP01DRAFT_360231 [Aspergillus saccharolyticus JOP 1030-1]